MLDLVDRAVDGELRDADVAPGWAVKVRAQASVLRFELARVMKDDALARAASRRCQTLADELVRLPFTGAQAGVARRIAQRAAGSRLPRR